MKSRNLFFFLIAYRYVELHVYLGNRYNILFDQRPFQRRASFCLFGKEFAAEIETYRDVHLQFEITSSYQNNASNRLSKKVLKTVKCIISYRKHKIHTRIFILIRFVPHACIDSILLIYFFKRKKNSFFISLTLSLHQAK